jgi:hypothetical protein
MNQAIPSDAVEEGVRVGVMPALTVAIFATALIAEAILTIINERANGDLMIMVCPILGSLFLSIAAVKAWWRVIRWMRNTVNTD